MGRPSLYTPELAAKICEQLAGGRSLLSISEEDWMPALSAVFVWLSKHKEFAESYTRAREIWAEAEFERMMHIADTPCEGETTKVVEGVNGTEVHVTKSDMTRHRELQVSTRKWVLERMAARKYGQLIKQEITNPDGSLNSRFTPEQRAAKLKAIEQAAKMRRAQAKAAPDDGSDLI